MTRVYLVRHAVHDLVGKTLAGRMPGVHLGVEGWGQAQSLAPYFAARDVTTVLSSPLERCLETAAPIADRLALTTQPEDDLNELDCGAWTGQSFATLRSDPAWQAWNSERSTASIPGGETAGDVRVRAMRVLARLGEAEREPAILVSHSDVIKIAILALLGAPVDRHDRLEIEPASVTTVDLWPGGGKVVRLNELAA